jgi:hypothetical protein
MFMAQKRQVTAKKILATKHTGRLRPHQHTSYGSLVLVLFLACSCVFVTSRTVSADDSSTYQTTAVVPAPVYKNSPTITNVQNGQIFRSANPVAITGSCPGTSQVEIYKNDVMAGAAACHGGSYQLAIALFGGSNALTARAYNANNIPSPDSAPVTVRLISIGTFLAATTNPFYISAAQPYQAAKTGEALSWQLVLNGGQAPYAVSVDWGDGKTELFSRTGPGTYSISHTYTYVSGSGNYTVVVHGTDQAASAAYVQLVALVRGLVAPVAVTRTSTTSTLTIATMTRITTVVFGAVGLTLAGFWLGEHRANGLLRSWGRA